METGVIVSTVAGYFFVQHGGELARCRARGKLKQQGVVPLAGDLVRFIAARGEGIIEEVLPRRNQLTRPAVANVDAAMAVVAADQPTPDLLLVDKILAMASYLELEPLVCVNKRDLAPRQAEELARLYLGAGYQAAACSALDGTGIDELAGLAAGKTVVLAGQSGVGKSHITTRIARPWPELAVEVGTISPKGRRGRHTTRQVTLLAGIQGGKIADTPGFSALVPDIPSSDLAGCFPDLVNLARQCRFSTCAHVHEPGCAVKQGVAAGTVAQSRYNNYRRLLDQIKAKEDSRY